MGLPAKSERSAEAGADVHFVTKLQAAHLHETEDKPAPSLLKVSLTRKHV